MPELALKSLVAYLLGSVAGALLLGQLAGFDIRREGSGNAGATNALRTRGGAFAAAVLAIDLAKGWLAVALVPLLPLVAQDPALARAWLAVACAAAVVLGHVYPCWYGFRGGKGAATLVGVLCALAPACVLPVLALWLGVLWLTGYVGLATMLAAAGFPLAWLAVGGGADAAYRVPVATFGVAAAVFTAYTHRANIARLRAGTEHRARRFVRAGLRAGQRA